MVSIFHLDILDQNIRKSYDEERSKDVTLAALDFTGHFISGHPLPFFYCLTKGLQLLLHLLMTIL